MDKQPIHSLSLSKGLVMANEFVAGWLNDSRGWGYGTDSQQDAVALVLQLSALREKALQGITISEEERASINDILQRYPMVLRFNIFSREGVPSFYEKTAQGPIPDPMDTIIQLARRGLLDRLRKCANCSKWFSATKPKKIYCSTACQQAKWRSTPEFKELNREYHRKYYREELSPKTSRHVRRQTRTAKGRKK